MFDAGPKVLQGEVPDREERPKQPRCKVNRDASRAVKKTPPPPGPRALGDFGYGKDLSSISRGGFDECGLNSGLGCRKHPLCRDQKGVLGPPWGVTGCFRCPGVCVWGDPGFSTAVKTFRFAVVAMERHRHDTRSDKHHVNQEDFRALINCNTTPATALSHPFLVHGA